MYVSILDKTAEISLKRTRTTARQIIHLKNLHLWPFTSYKSLCFMVINCVIFHKWGDVSRITHSS